MFARLMQGFIKPYFVLQRLNLTFFTNLVAVVSAIPERLYGASYN